MSSLWGRVRVAALFLFLWGCGAERPQTPAATSPAEARAAVTQGNEAREAATPGLFLYEVQSQAGRSYLLGTIHVGFGFDDVLTDAGRRAFDESTRVWLEADIASADPQALLYAAMLPPDQSLRAIVGDSLWVELTGVLGSVIPPAAMDRLKPWMPAMLLGLSRIEQVLQEERPNSLEKRMDLEVYERAKVAGKSLHYLETVEDQVRVFEAIPVAVQVREIQHALSDESLREGRNMLKAFAAGDEAALAHALFDVSEGDENANLQAALLDQRNARWLPILTAEVEKGGAFIAVGAAHLLGETGLLRAFQQKGHAVTRVR